MLQQFFDMIVSRLRDAAVYHPNFPFRKTFLSWFDLTVTNPLALSSSGKEKIVCADSANFCVKSPHWMGGQSQVHAGRFPEVSAYSLKDAIVSAYSNGVVADGNLLLSALFLQNCDRFINPGETVFKQTPTEFFVKTGVSIEIPQAIHAGGAGAANWYHFILECLPKVFLIRNLPPEFENIPLLVPEECCDVSSYAEAIQVFSGGRSLIPLSRSHKARVGKLILFDEVSFGPFNMKKGEWPRVSDYSQHDEVLKSFIEEFRAHMPRKKVLKSTRKRIFLARPGIRRNFNQEELIAIASKYGILPVYMETLSLDQQAQVFAEASVIIGPSGAAWTGMIFSERPFVGLSWLPSGYKEFSSFSSLANLLGHRLTFIEAKTHNELLSTSDVYSADYTVCPLEFEDALRHVLGELA